MYVSSPRVFLCRNCIIQDVLADLNHTSMINALNRSGRNSRNICTTKIFLQNQEPRKNILAAK